jgi:hypothetical protein
MSPPRFGPCLCGATDCPSCGPAQGYEVVRRNGRWVNPEPGDEEPDFAEPEPDDARDLAAEFGGRDYP